MPEVKDRWIPNMKADRVADNEEPAELREDPQGWSYL